MLKNMEQYQATKQQIEKFQKTLDDLNDEKKTADFHPKLIKAKKDALLSEIAIFQKSLDEYDQHN
jgi:hypothetical protein